MRPSVATEIAAILRLPTDFSCPEKRGFDGFFSEGTVDARQFGKEGERIDAQRVQCEAIPLLPFYCLLCIILADSGNSIRNFLAFPEIDG